MSPEGLITSEFDDAAIIDSEVDAVTVVDDDPDDLAELELVVLELDAVTVADDEGLRPVPGAEELIRGLRAGGVAVVLTTDRSRGDLDAVLDVVAWRGLADLSLSAAEAGRGGPNPDLPLTALLRTGGTGVDAMVVVASTADGIASGLAAGAGLVVGVTAGAHDEQALTLAGADAVIGAAAELGELLGLDDDLDGLEAFGFDDQAEGLTAR